MKDESERDLFNNIVKISKEMKMLSDVAFIQYKNQVDDIISGEIDDEQKIALVMDGILDFCQFDNMLLLFKKLCRELYVRHPLLVKNYIAYYREMWDEDGRD